MITNYIKQYYKNKNNIYIIEYLLKNVDKNNVNWRYYKKLYNIFIHLVFLREYKISLFHVVYDVKE